MSSPPPSPQHAAALHDLLAHMPCRHYPRPREVGDHLEVNHWKVLEALLPLQPRVYEWAADDCHACVPHAALLLDHPASHDTLEGLHAASTDCAHEAHLFAVLLRMCRPGLSPADRHNRWMEATLPIPITNGTAYPGIARVNNLWYASRWQLVDAVLAAVEQARGQGARAAVAAELGEALMRCDNGMALWVGYLAARGTPADVTVLGEAVAVQEGRKVSRVGRLWPVGDFFDMPQRGSALEVMHAGYNLLFAIAMRHHDRPLNMLPSLLALASARNPVTTFVWRAALARPGAHTRLLPALRAAAAAAFSYHAYADVCMGVAPETTLVWVVRMFELLETDHEFHALLLAATQQGHVQVLRAIPELHMQASLLDALDALFRPGTPSPPHATRRTVLDTLLSIYRGPPFALPVSLRVRMCNADPTLVGFHQVMPIQA